MASTRTIFANTLLYTYTKVIELHIKYSSHTLLTAEGILILISNKAKNAHYIMTYL